MKHNKSLDIHIVKIAEILKIRRENINKWILVIFVNIIGFYACYDVRKRFKKATEKLINGK